MAAHDLLWRKQSARRQTRAALLAAALLLGASPVVLAPAIAQQVMAPRLDPASLRAWLAATMAPPGRPMPADVTSLDRMVQGNDAGGLSKRLAATRTAEELNLDLNWEQTQTYNGAGFLTAYAYLHDLWRLGSSLPDAQGDALKQSAGMMLVYSLDLIVLDGPKCADQSAPAHRRDQLFAQNQPIIAYIRSLPSATRMTLGTISLAIEGATAGLRRNDDVLCSGGLDEIGEGLKAQGAKPLKQVPNVPGTFGKTYAVPPAPGYKARFVGEDVWKPKQALARQSLPAALTNLLTLSTAPQAVPGAN